MQHSPFPSLPCYPCPHASACCAHGVALARSEVEAIRNHYGAGLIYRTRWGEWRTRIVKGRCVFLKDNACTIYNKPYYPAVCRGFPWFDAKGEGPYEYEREICPEFTKRPELVQLNPYRARAG